MLLLPYSYSGKKYQKSQKFSCWWMPRKVKNNFRGISALVIIWSCEYPWWNRLEQPNITGDCLDDFSAAVLLSYSWIKRCSENMQLIYTGTPMPKCDINKVASQLYWNHTSKSVFPCKFASYFQNTFLLRIFLGGCFWFFIVNCVKYWLPASLKVKGIGDIVLLLFIFYTIFLYISHDTSADFSQAFGYFPQYSWIFPTILLDCNFCS